MLTEQQKAMLRARQVDDLKQACLDLMKATGELFDRFEEHGLEAAWRDDGAGVVVRMEVAHEALRSVLARQATQRMLALGASPEGLAGLVTMRGRGRARG